MKCIIKLLILTLILIAVDKTYSDFRNNILVLTPQIDISLTNLSDFNISLKDQLSPSLTKYFKPINSQICDIYLSYNDLVSKELFNDIDRCVTIGQDLSAIAVIVFKLEKNSNKLLIKLIKLIDFKPITYDIEITQVKSKTDIPRIVKEIEDTLNKNFIEEINCNIPDSAELIQSYQIGYPSWLLELPKSKNQLFFIGYSRKIKNKNICKAISIANGKYEFISTYYNRLDGYWNAILKKVEQKDKSARNNTNIIALKKEIYGYSIFELSKMLRSAQTYYEEVNWDSKDEKSIFFNSYTLLTTSKQNISKPYMEVLNKYKDLKDKSTQLMVKYLTSNAKKIFNLKQAPLPKVHSYKSIVNVKPQFQDTEEKKQIEPVLAKKKEMILIKGGLFLPARFDHFADSSLRNIKSFYMDKFEVTNEEFKEFVFANPKWKKNNAKNMYADENYLFDWDGDNIPEGEDKLPVKYISWSAALAYAKWVGKKLPNELEWEYAAGGVEHTVYSSGNKFVPPKKSNDESSSVKEQDSPNTFGLNNMCGSAWEWCKDWYSKYYFVKRPAYSSKYKVLRGGSKDNVSPSNLMTTTRYYAKPEHTFNTGFRCIKYADEDVKTVNPIGSQK